MDPLLPPVLAADGSGGGQPLLVPHLLPIWVPHLLPVWVPHLLPVWLLDRDAGLLALLYPADPGGVELARKPDPVPSKRLSKGECSALGR